MHQGAVQNGLEGLEIYVYILLLQEDFKITNLLLQNKYSITLFSSSGINTSAYLNKNAKYFVDQVDFT
jgi:hypothetical protein